MPSKGLRDVPRAAVLRLCHMVLITTLLPRQLPAEVLLGQQTPARGAALLQAPKYKTQTFLLKALGYNSSNGRMGFQQQVCQICNQLNASETVHAGTQHTPAHLHPRSTMREREIPRT